MQYATGSYIFAVRTHSVYFFNGLAVEHARFQASASLPVIYQTSPWISYGGLGALPSGGPQHGTVGGQRPGGRHGAGPAGRRNRIALPATATYADLGIGDPSLRMDVTLLHGGAGPALRLVGSVNPPVADVDRGFGTGAWDGGVGLAVSQRLVPWFLFGEAMHWWLGDMDDLRLQNALSYSASVGRAFRDGRIGTLATLSGYTAIIDGTDPTLQAALGISYQPGPGRYSLSLSTTVGLTESVPGWSAAVGWCITL